MTTGRLLRKVSVTESSVRLEVVTPKSKKTWRVVPIADIPKHVEDWAKENGVSVEES
jgi:hypothetical protein